MILRNKKTGEMSKNETHYLVKVWVYHSMVDKHESASLHEARKWLKEEGWIEAWTCGNCAFDVYKNGREVDFDTLDDYGFYDMNKEEEE